MLSDSKNSNSATCKTNRRISPTMASPSIGRLGVQCATANAPKGRGNFGTPFRVQGGCCDHSNCSRCWAGSRSIIGVEAGVHNPVHNGNLLVPCKK